MAPLRDPPKTRIALLSESKLIAEALTAKIAQAADLVLVGAKADLARARDVARSTSVDVVILVSNRAIEDKVDCVRSLTGNGSCGKVLVLCSEPASWHVALRLVRAGARGFLSAEVGSDEVVQAVRAITAGRLSLPPALERKLAERQLLGYDKLPEELLTDRELQVLRKLAQGHTNKEIAGLLCISPKTVDAHRANVLSKLGLRNNSDLTRFALEIGVLHLT